MLSGPLSQRMRKSSVLFSPCPPTRASAKCFLGESFSANAAWIPPSAIMVLESPRRNFVAKWVLSPDPSSANAAEAPAPPPPNINISVSISGFVEYEIGNGLSASNKSASSKGNFLSPAFGPTTNVRSFPE